MALDHNVVCGNFLNYCSIVGRLSIRSSEDDFFPSILTVGASVN